MSGSAGPPTIAVVGAGAAGLFAAIWAGRTARFDGADLRIVALDGARTLGAKILVAGGGRCNVTHEVVDERAYAGSTRPAIRNVLRRFGVEETVRFFAEMGVTLKRERTGKLFPADDRARSVLDALLRAAREAGVELRNPWRVERLERVAEAGDDAGPRFRLLAADGATLQADRVVLATGGCSLPRSGSDGHGFEMARALGHTTTPRIVPALVPLVLTDGHPLRGLSGVAARAVVEVRSGSGKRLASFEGDVLCTHFGLSGPAILDVSRYWSEARADDSKAMLVLNWLPGEEVARLEGRLASAREAGDGHRTASQFLRAHLPERLADTLLRLADVDARRTLAQLTRDERRRVATSVCAMDAPVVGDRGWTHAEVTAGGVPLAEVHLASLESRRCPALHLCGEILDVDGRIGGFNFQWAWASGFVAGTGAGRSGEA